MQVGLAPTEYAEKLEAIIESTEVWGKVRLVAADGERLWGVEWRATELNGKTIVYLLNLTRSPLTVAIEELRRDARLKNLVDGDNVSRDCIEAAPLRPFLIAEDFPHGH